MKKASIKGQSLVEYIMIVGIVVVALFAIAPMFKRAAQGVVKATADQLATQKDAEQDFTPGAAHMESTQTFGVTQNKRTVREVLGVVNVSVEDSSSSNTGAKTDMGFSR